VGIIGQMNRYCTLIALWNATKYAMCTSSRKARARVNAVCRTSREREQVDEEVLNGVVTGDRPASNGEPRTTPRRRLLSATTAFRDRPGVFRRGLGDGLPDGVRHDASSPRCAACANDGVRREQAGPVLDSAPHDLGPTSPKGIRWASSSGLPRPPTHNATADRAPPYVARSPHLCCGREVERSPTLS
jgi:hypothetical protein